MPTQEERLGTVEYGLKQFQTETIRAYQDMAFEVTMLKGLTEDSVKRLMKLERTVEQRFDRVDQRLGTMEQDMSEVKGLLAQILERLPKS